MPSASTLDTSEQDATRPAEKVAVGNAELQWTPLMENSYLFDERHFVRTVFFSPCGFAVVVVVVVVVVVDAVCLDCSVNATLHTSVPANNPSPKKHHPTLITLSKVSSA